jgi:hypothetical protein
MDGRKQRFPVFGDFDRLVAWTRRAGVDTEFRIASKAAGSVVDSGVQDVILFRV